MAETPLADIAQLTIIGPGLLGGSVGLGLRRAGFAGRIVGVARSASTREQAKQVGAIDAGADSVDSAIPPTGRCMVVVAVPLSCFAETFGQLAKHQRAGVVVTDVGSTKCSVVADAKRHLAEPEFFVPAHPMAGSEQQGPGHASADLFHGKPCVLCPDDSTDAAALAGVRELWAALGCALTEMTAQQHDTQVAAVSHLPHLLAVLLAQTAEGMGPLDLASTGFRSATRLASSNPPMRADIIAANRERIAEALDFFTEQLAGLRDEVRHGKRDDLLARLNKAKHIRDAWMQSVEKNEDTRS